MKPSTRSRWLLLGMAAVVVILDQLSKFWVVNNLPPYESASLLPWLDPVFSLTHVTNTGVAFGLFPQFGQLFSILSALVVLMILLFQRSLPANQIWIHIALGLVTGGALGNNLIDRIFRGAVVDFIDVNFWPFQAWPVFNVADSSIVIGVAILLLDSLFSDFEVEEEEPVSGSTYASPSSSQDALSCGSEGLNV